jgi:(p)ppGpp synthase/HD superfamily hydrolase
LSGCFIVSLLPCRAQVILGAMGEAPDFTAGNEFLERAFRHADEAHRRGDTDISHPVAVACLLDEAGFRDPVIAAALLHDVVEDTGEAFDAIEEEFGPEVTDLVDAMTEDSEIEDYAERKSEHRRRVLSSGPAPASIYAADKLARVRAYVASGDEVDPDRLQHYRDTLRLFTAVRPELPFLSELATELPELERRNGSQRA